MLDGVIRAVSADMISMFHAYLLDEFYSVQHLVDHEQVLVHTQGHTAGAALTTAGVRKMLRRACRRAGLGAHVTPHAFRHKAASAFYAASDFNAEMVAEEFGWASADMVTQLYGKSANRQLNALSATSLGSHGASAVRTAPRAFLVRRSRATVTVEVRTESITATAALSSAANYLELTFDKRYEVISQQFPPWLLQEPIMFPRHHETYGWACRVPGCQSWPRDTDPRLICHVHGQEHTGVKNSIRFEDFIRDAKPLRVQSLGWPLLAGPTAKSAKATVKRRDTAIAQVTSTISEKHNAEGSTNRTGERLRPPTHDSPHRVLSTDACTTRICTRKSTTCRRTSCATPTTCCGEDG